MTWPCLPFQVFVLLSPKSLCSWVIWKRKVVPGILYLQGNLSAADNSVCHLWLSHVVLLLNINNSITQRKLKSYNSFFLVWSSWNIYTIPHVLYFFTAMSNQCTFLNYLCIPVSLCLEGVDIYNISCSFSISSMPISFLPQGFCTYSSLYLEHCSPYLLNLINISSMS